ncbi:MAG: four-carbon acid sugar kinase family protein [Lachnospirales bacterium]
MIKMLVIADDFTGALDTGVQFTRRNLYTKITTNIDFDYTNINDDLDILVIDAQTRHLSHKEAYNVVKSISKKAIAKGVEYIYKKTDSALRGNIGSELKGLLDSSSENSVYFIPALPKHNRFTKKGVHYIDYIPVAESVFGNDPFEPVKYSEVNKIISLQTDINITEVYNINESTTFEEGIVIFDASSDDDLNNIANKLYNDVHGKLFAGCAGFASVLPDLLGIRKKENKKIVFDNGLLVACGSVNPITTKQIINGKKNNFKYFSMNKDQKLDKNWISNNKSQYTTTLKDFSKDKYIIIDANNIKETHLINPNTFAKENNASLDEVRNNISVFIGHLVKDFIDRNNHKNIMIIGGDTLFAFIKNMGIELLEPLEEIYDGVVLSVFEYKNVKYNLISKSGGFGDENLIPNLVKIIENNI